MPKDDATFLNMFYLAFAVCVGYVTWKMSQMIGVQMNWIEKYDQWYPMASVASAVLVGFAGTYYLRANNERHEYLLDAVGELRKVSWPSADDTRKMTIIVVVVVGIFAAILSVFDFLWSGILKFVL